jgi:hypothetical protein
MRVSEGHTRGFRKRLTKILRNSNLPLFYKIELLLMGFRYAKYILLTIIIILDIAFLLEKGFDNIINDNLYKIAFIFQSLSLLIYLTFITVSVNIYLKNKRQFNIADSFYLLLLNICTIPAFLTGSVFGIIRDEGSFYKTDRNK